MRCERSWSNFYVEYFQNKLTLLYDRRRECSFIKTEIVAYKKRVVEKREIFHILSEIVYTIKETSVIFVDMLISLFIRR